MVDCARSSSLVSMSKTRAERVLTSERSYRVLYLRRAGEEAAGSFRQASEADDEFEIDGRGAWYDIYWTCVDDWNDSTGDLVGQTGWVSNISGSSLFAAKMCYWVDDY